MYIYTFMYIYIELFTQLWVHKPSNIQSCTTTGGHLVYMSITSCWSSKGGIEAIYEVVPFF